MTHLNPVTSNFADTKPHYALLDGLRGVAALLCAMLMIPALPGCSYEIRGNGEMFPLNGPAWSLFFEYIGNILYALFIRRLSTLGLGILAGMLSLVLLGFTIADPMGYGMFGVGWTLDGINFWGGLIRMFCPFTIGMLLARKFRPVRVVNHR